MRCDMFEKQTKAMTKSDTCAPFITIVIIFVVGLLLFSGCTTPTDTSLSKRIPEIQPGILQGYLMDAELPNSLTLLPPPPKEGSVGFELDQEIAMQYLALEDKVRKKQAKRDSILTFPEAPAAFNGVLPVPISENMTPHLYMILRRTLADAVLSTHAAKDYYQRPRPFMVNQTPTLTPKEDDHLRKNGAYPSGHTAIGWAWALILAELFPDQSDAILKRGSEFGISRIVCNVHWHSDVMAGQTMGAATVARLHADKDFLIDLKAAKWEVLKANDNNTWRDIPQESKVKRELIPAN